ncbi:MAG: NnrU family protein [Gammaproteobacteria bacterium]|nr:NnrU family protein [Gammaproteobacteria bacterium]
MTLILAGLLLFAGVHLLPGVAPGLRDRLVSALSTNGYKGLFALLSLAGIVLLSMGWRSSMPSSLYVPPGWGVFLNLALMLPALVLVLPTAARSNLARFVRHPQLTGVLIWSMAHLFVNGESRSLLVFGGIGVWALAEIWLLSRRQGPRPAIVPVPVSRDLVALAAGVAVYGAVFVFHPYLSGVRLAGFVFGTG